MKGNAWKYLKYLLYGFLALHVAEIITCVVLLAVWEPGFTPVFRAIVKLMGYDIALSAFLLLGLAVVGMQVQNDSIPTPPNAKRLLALSIIHLVSTIAVAVTLVFGILLMNL